MDTTITRTASTHTFGTPEQSAIRAPKPQRKEASPAQFLQVDRPTLVRSQTPNNTAEDQAAIAKMFSENMFSDPPVKKQWGLGPELHSDGHKRLIYILREECGRLYSFNQSLKNKLAHYERNDRHQASHVTQLQNQYHARGEKLAQVTNELREAQDSLKEMDAMIEQTRSKRMSRLYTANDLEGAL